MSDITSKRRRQLDAAFLAGARGFLNLVGRECNNYRLAEGQADLRRAYYRGWDWAAEHPPAARSMMTRQDGPS